MYKRLLTGLATLLPIALLPLAVAAQPNENWTDVNLSVVDYHVIPRYADFAAASARLAPAAAALCRTSDRSNMGAMQAAYHDAMDAWQGIQQVQFGPVTYFNWNYRLQFWPDERDTGGRQLDALIAGRDAAQLAEGSFARQSVGVQGFPALERLLFEAGSLQALREDEFRCRVLETIAANIGASAAGVHQRWVEEFRATVATADERGFFESARDATLDLLKAQIEPLARLRDQKVGPPLGESFERARARRAESWRSGRSLRNLKINVAALEQMFTAPQTNSVPLSSVFLDEDRAAVRAQFAATREVLDTLPASMADALEDEALYGRVGELHTALDQLYEAMEQALKNTDLYLGFNSLDGD